MYNADTTPIQRRSPRRYGYTIPLRTQLPHCIWIQYGLRTMGDMNKHTPEHLPLLSS